MSILSANKQTLRLLAALAALALCGGAYAGTAASSFTVSVSSAAASKCSIRSAAAITGGAPSVTCTAGTALPAITFKAVTLTVTF